MQDQNAQQKQQEKEKQEAQRQQILDSLLSSEAKERLGRVKLVKPEKAAQVESALLLMAQQGKIGGPIPDDQIRQMLESLRDKVTEIKIEHRGKNDDAWDDDEDGWA
mgnify:CR=1 FL=1